jgi:hypothetical protein
MDLKGTGCEDGRWIELARDRVQWRALVLSILNIGFVLPECLVISRMNPGAVGDVSTRSLGRWR